MEGDVGFLGEIDWNDLSDLNLLEWEPEPPLLTDSSASSSSSPSYPSSAWIDEIENLLMKDEDDDKVAPKPDDDYCQNFLADILVNSPEEETPGAADPKTNSENEKEEEEVVEVEVELDAPELDNDSDETNSKKRRRQLRNRDAAVRSRERKKMYVKDLEMKSKYLEGECRRLGRLLQCCYAENHALRLTLQMGNAFGASTTKQESAVLLLESLLLGSLLWFLGIMCLFTLPVNPLLNQETVQVEDEGKRAPQNVAPRELGSKKFGYVGVLYFVKSRRRCKASWTKMKQFPGCASILIC